MAGFVGIFGEHVDARLAVSEAIAATVYSQKTSVRDLIETQQAILSESYYELLETGVMQAHREAIYVWVAGEIYNQRELNCGATLFADLLLQSYLDNALESLLPQVNGVYYAIIYDETKKIVKVITDRYGLKPLYFCHGGKELLVAAEVKCFPFFKSFKPVIRKDVIECFIQLEHFMDNDTWFENVFIAAPSTIYSFSINNHTLVHKRYWSWSEIKRTSLSINEAADQMGFLIDTVSKSRFSGAARVGVALSGGLDSRALVAAVHKLNPVTYTFGTPNSRDVRIAKQVTALAGVKHYHYNTYTEHWLSKRFAGIWKTDGMLNMLHMHYSHLMNEIANIMDINLSGFLGDAVLGGSYLEKKGKVFLNTRINPSIAQHYYGAYHERSNLSDSFFDIDKIDPYLFYNRGRRMIGMGAEEPYKTVPQRLPFMDNNLMDLSYSLPDQFRVHSRVYNKALLNRYPGFYVSIPHATTGVPISTNPTLFNKALKKYNRWMWIVKYKLGMQTSYVNVQNWICEPETAKLIMEILNPKSAMYPNFTNINFHDRYLIPHLHKKGNFVRPIMGALTMEIWLQQILNKKYIPVATPDTN